MMIQRTEAFQYSRKLLRAENKLIRDQEPTIVKPDRRVRKNIAIVIGQLSQGGSERQLYQFLEQCDHAIWKPTVFVSGELGVYVQLIEKLNIEVVLLKGGRAQKMIQFRRECTNRHISRFFSWSSYTNVYGLSLVGLGVKRIGSFRNKGAADLPSNGRWFWSWMSMAGISAAVCNSKETAQEMRSIGRELLGVTYVPNSIKVMQSAERHQHRTRWRAKLKLKEEDILILGVGRLIKQKNFKRFIEVIHGLRHKEGFHAVIAGQDFGEKQCLEDQIQQLGLSTIVRLIGQVPDARSLMCAADIFLLTSDHEGMPNVIMEAMAAGVPCVTTDVNGVGELIVDEKTGFITEKRIDEIISRVLGLLENRAAREKIGSQAMKFVSKKFNAKVANDRLWDMCK